MSEKRVETASGIVVLCAMFLNIARSTSHIIMAHKSGIGVIQTILIAFFVFTIGYRIESIPEEKQTIEYYRKYLPNRYIRIVSWLSIMMIFSVAISFALGLQNRIDKIWGNQFIDRILGPISNVLGVADLFGYRWIVDSWKYVGYFLFLLIVAPLIHFIVERLKPIWGIGICAVASIVLAYYFPEKTRIWMIPIFMIGMTIRYNQILPRTENGQELNSQRRIRHAYHCVFIAWLLHVQIYFWWAKKIFAKIGNGLLISLVSTIVICFCAIMIYAVVKRFYTNYSIPGKREKFIDFIASILLVIANYIFVFYNSIPAFLTNDDSRIQHVLSGSYLGSVYPVHPYIHGAISFPISKLFSVFPDIPWWYLFCQLLMILGMIAFHYVTIRLTRKGQIPLLVMLALLEVFEGALIWFNIWRLSFTLSSIIVGCASIVLLFCLNDYEKNVRARSISASIAVAICFLLSCFVRVSAGYVLTAYIVLISFYIIFSDFNSVFKRGVKLVLIVIVGLGAVVAIEKSQNVIIEKVNGRDFLEFNRARSAFMDYPHDSYEENPQLYQSVGWDEDTFFLAESWCFMTDNVTTDALNKITAKRNVGIWKNIQDSWDETINNQGTILALIIYSLSIFLIVICLMNKFNKRLFATGLLNVVGTMVLSGYLIWKGRLIYRSLLVVIIPAVVINLLLFFSNYRMRLQRKKLACFLTALVCVALIIPICSSAFQTKSKEKNMQNKFAIQNDAYVYFKEHQSNIYISEVYSLVELNPFDLGFESNMFYYGGSLFHSDIMNKKAEKLGIADMNGNVFKQSNVYYVSRINIEDKSKFESRNTLSAFYNTLKKDYGAIGIQKIDSIDQMLWVYRFIYEDSEQRPLEYYDIIEGTPVIVGD